MTLATVGTAYTPTRTARPTELVAGSLGVSERKTILDHIGRRAIHAHTTREFSHAWRVTPDGTKPRLIAATSPALGRCQYAVLSHPQRTAVLVLDVDQPGRGGGVIESLAPLVRERLSNLAARGVGPALIGINPLSGKCQVLWLIDPVFAGAGQESANTRLLAATARRLAQFLGADPHFSGVWSRSPLYTGNDPKAYKWHAQHLQIDRLAVLNQELKMRQGTDTAQRFSSGRQLIEAARKRREEAAAAHTLLSALDADFAAVEPAGPGYIDGVKIRWVSAGRAARDETAFTHALAVAYRRRSTGLPLTDAALIEAYEHGYAVAQAVGADHRGPDLPPPRDRQTMARRVRGYVVQGTRRVGSGVSAASSAERKALATMGRRGGQAAAKRWKTDPEGEYAAAQRANLAAANESRSLDTDENKGRVLAYISRERRAKREPSTREVANELGLSERRVRQLRAELGMQARKGRPKKTATP